MRILIFNWRDIKNPNAGGAEVYTHEIFKRLAKKHEIIQFSAAFPGCKNEETVDNVKIIRKGNFLTVYFWAFWFYITKIKGKIDLVVDECNTLPFFTSFYVKERKVFLIHQLAVEFWDYEVFWPLSWIGKFLEPLYLGLYKKIKTTTVSESTKSDLVKLGFEEINIVPNGSNLKPVDKIPGKSRALLVVFIGRFKKAKKPDDALKALIKAHESIPKLEAIMIGDGYLRKKLESMAPPYVKITGRISEEEKYNYLKKAHVLIVPGVREGWGQVVIEANSFGVPAVAYDVHGLRDAIIHKKTGLLVENNTEKLAEAIVKVLNNEELRERLSKNALKWSKKFSWDKSAKEFEAVVCG